MSHHSDGPRPIVSQDAIKKFLKRGQSMQVDINEILKRSPFEVFPPLGMLPGDDKNEIQFSVGIRDGKVVVDFDTPVKSFGMTADSAREVGKTLIKHAKKINKG
jgi:hypothetical protein